VTWLSRGALLGIQVCISVACSGREDVKEGERVGESVGECVGVAVTAEGD
jgi:hypothetical protein